MATIAEALALAGQCLRAGDPAQAEHVSRQILRASPTHLEALFLLGRACHRLGKLDEALRCFDQMLGAAPGLAQVHHARGLVFQDRGDPAAARCFREAAVLAPDWPPARMSLGIALQAQGKLDEAETCFREVLRRWPNLPEAHGNLGLALQAQGKLDEAAACHREVLRRKPDLGAAHNNLGDVFFRQGKLDEAAACYRQAVRLLPGCAEAHYNLGNVLRGQGRDAEAGACFQQALRLQPGFGMAHNNLGEVLAEDGQRELAAACFRQVLRLPPGPATVPANQGHLLAHLNLGVLRLEEGQREEAADHLRAALRLDPGSIQALVGVAVSGLFPLADADVARMKALLADPGLAPLEACQLHFALGNLANRAGAHDEGFAHFRKGNARRRRLFQEEGTAFDAEAHRAWVERLLATCDAAHFRRVQGFGVDTERPLFIVGMPRSGTSLVEQILASHADVFGAGELKDVTRLADALPARLGAAEDYPSCLAQLDAATARAAAAAYLERLDRLGGAARRVTDKMPDNFMHLGLLAALFPRARVVHCRRDPLDVCVSCYLQCFTGLNFAWDLGDIGRYYRQYERVMAHWRAVLPLPVLEVVYEDLVADPEAVSRRLVDFCGLAWDDRCLAFHETPRAVRTASLLQVRRPIYKDSVGRWRRFEAHLGPLREALGEFHV